MKKNKPYSRIKKCQWCANYFIYNHNRQVYCNDECKKYAKQDQWRNSKTNTRKRDKMNGIKKEEEGTIGLGPKMYEDTLRELMAVHKQAMIIRGTYTKARFNMEIKQLEKQLATS